MLGVPVTLHDGMGKQVGLGEVIEGEMRFTAPSDMTIYSWQSEDRGPFPLTLPVRMKARDTLVLVLGDLLETKREVTLANLTWAFVDPPVKEA